MDIRSTVIQKYEEFQRFLETVDVESLKTQFNRQELTEFRSQLYNLKQRSLAFEIGKIIDEMKVEEFPQILGVHRYPDVLDIDFLGDKGKIELDKHLSKFRVGEYLTRLYQFAGSNENSAKLENFLLERGIAERFHILLCPHCTEGHLSAPLNDTDFECLKKEIAEAKTDEDFEAIDERLETYCGECSDHVDVTVLAKKPLQVDKRLKLAKKKDTALDEV